MAFDNKKPIELEQGWKYMEEGITKLKAILEDDKNKEAFTAEHYMMLYTTIYNMCTQKPPFDHSEQLYNRYKEAFVLYIQEKVLPSLRDQNDERLLAQLVQRWQNHKIMIRWLSRFFNYLDRYFIQRHNLHSLNDVGLLVFRDHVYVEIKNKAKDAVIKLIEAEREGEQVDGDLLRNVLSIFQEVGMGALETYQIDFEEPLLKDTAAYYRLKAAAWIQEDSTPDFLVKAEQCLKAEEARVDSYLHASTKAKLLKEAETELLKENQTELLEKEGSGGAALLIDDKKSDLARMHRLFQRIPKGLDPLADLFRKHIEEEGRKLVEEATNAVEAKKEKDKAAGKVAKDSTNSPDHQFIRNVVDLHDKYSEYVHECFASGPLFHKALKEAFEHFCNKQVGQSTVAELMAGFCDTLLRKGGSEKMSDEDLDQILDKVVKLLAFISDKDLFAEFYRKRLSRRLLNGNSASEDSEKALLTRLKQQCGQQFTNKMEGMVTDLQMAKEKEKQFSVWLADNRIELPLDINVTVLTTGFWPTMKQLDINLPEAMMQGVDKFNMFHEQTNNSRRLTWQHSQGQVHVKASYDKQYELVMPVLCATILLLFSEDGEFTYEGLQETTKIPSEDIDRCLLALCMGKYKLLTKQPAGRNFSKTDTFSVNTKFSEKQRRIKIALPTIEDRRKVTDDVDKDRKHQIEAAIVRIMKSRKTLQHQQLIMEVVQQLQKMFQPDIKLIKRSVESLIEREYLERDANNQQTYKYMA